MSLSSMTGFGRAEGTLDAWSWVVEARSVNGRSLEVRFRGPPGFEGLERIARDGAQARFGAPLLAAGKVGPPNLDGLLSLPGVVRVAETETADGARAEVEAAIGASIARAMDGLAASRKAEGRAIALVLEGLLQRIAALMSEARSEAARQPSQMKARLERRMIELLGEAVSAERLAQEAALLAVRADVTEELDRLDAHLAAAHTLLADDGAVGRRLDFLVQEFMREANTLASKSASQALTAHGLELKAAIDQLREQVQNVE
jgi:uncharacterized protein (TIGR00255 family)